MSEIDLEAIRARVKKYIHHLENSECSDELTKEDGIFISNSREQIPALCDEIERLRARVKELEGIMGVTENRYRVALESISKNSCCDSCQEAKLVALQALKIEGDEPA